MEKTEDKSPSDGEREEQTDKGIDNFMIPLSGGVKEYFEKNGITVEDKNEISRILGRYLYAKGLNKLHELIDSLEDKIVESKGTVEDWDSPLIEEIIDTIIDGAEINGDIVRNSLISMALKK